MIAVSTAISSSLITELNTSCEILWVKIQPYYRHHVSDQHSRDQLEESLAVSGTQVWLARDFNAPNIDRQSTTAIPAGIKSVMYLLRIALIDIVSCRSWSIPNGFRTNN